MSASALHIDGPQDARGPMHRRQSLPKGPILHASLLHGVGLGLAFAVSVFLEALILPQMHIGALEVVGWQVSNVAKFLTALVVTAVAAKAQKTIECSWMPGVAIAFTVCGTVAGVSSLGLTGPLSFALSIMGIVAICAVSTFTLMEWMLRLSRHDSIVARVALPVALFFSVIPFTLVFYLEELQIWLFALAAAACSLFLLHVSSKASINRTISPERRPVRLRPQVFIGLVVLIAAGRLSENLVVANAGMALPLGVLSIAAAGTVMVAMFVLYPATSYVNAARVIVTLFVFSYVMAAMDWFTGSVAAFLAYTAGRFLICTLILAGIELASSVKGCSLRVIACAYAIQASGTVFDAVIPTLGLSVLNSASAAVMGIALAFAAIWLLNERSIGATFSEFSEEPHPCVPHACREETAKATFGFTPKESEICDYLMEGRSIPFIAEALVVSENTVKSHVSRMYAKTGVHTRQEFITVVRGVE